MEGGWCVCGGGVDVWVAVMWIQVGVEWAVGCGLEVGWVSVVWCGVARWCVGLRRGESESHLLGGSSRPTQPARLTIPRPPHPACLTIPRPTQPVCLTSPAISSGVLSSMADHSKRIGIGHVWPVIEHVGPHLRIDN